MSDRSIAALCSAICCTACGGRDQTPDSLTISGVVTIRTADDGGPEVNVQASVLRMFPDGGSESVFDAGVALNDQPLGDGAIEDRGPDAPPVLTWTRPSFPGVGFGLPQRFSVIESLAEATFTCPVEVTFTAPEDGATMGRGAPIDFQWTPGGSMSFLQALTYQFFSPETGEFFFGVAFVNPGLTAYSLDVPPGLPARDLDGLFDLFVSGESDDFKSGCQVSPRRRLHFPYRVPSGRP